jgi:hypothetical protein
MCIGRGFVNALRNAMRANRWLVTLVGPAADLGRLAVRAH